MCLLKHITSLVFLILPFISFSQTDNKISIENFLSSYIRIPSVSGNERKAGIFLEKFCREKGLITKLFTDSDTAYNFSASLYPLSSGKPNIIFLNHIDVVSPSDSLSWKYPAFSGTIADSGVWGRGAIDCKGLAAMQLFAISRFAKAAKEKDLPYNFTLLCVSDEELGGTRGSGLITKSFLTLLHPIVVFGEGGSGMNKMIPSKPDTLIFGISVAEKSTLWLRLEVNVTNSGHGAMPHELYANKQMVRALNRLLDVQPDVKFSAVSLNMFCEMGRMEGGVKGFVIRHINWKLFWPFVKKYFKEDAVFSSVVNDSFVITNVNNPAGASNQTAGKATAILDCRLLPGTDPIKFIEKIKSVVGKKITVSIISQGQNEIPSKENLYFKMMSIALKSAYPASEVVPILFPASTDNNYYRKAGVPAFGIIPVHFSLHSLESVHGANEFIRVSDLEKGTEVYSLFIENMLK